MYLEPHIGLVLEGGGMRGVFTAGVLDYFLEQDIHFHYAVGVSAGACNGLSYMSRQHGRARRANVDMLKEHQYIGLKYLWTQKSILDLDTLYNKIPNEWLPFDYEACFANPTTFEMVVTNCHTGLAEYLTERSDAARLVRVAQASSSLPFVCPVIDVDGKPMLDGGIVDSIPVQRAFDTGHTFCVVVSTRNKGYRERTTDRKIPRFIYSKYPRLRVALSHRVATYNKQLDLLDALEAARRVLVIRPELPIEVDRLEKNPEKLNKLYREGYDCAHRAMTVLLDTPTSPVCDTSL